MANVDDYISGKILKNVELTVNSLKFIGIPILGPSIGEELLKRISSFQPKTIDMKQASDLILNSKECAVGEHIAGQ